jgi:muramoyltetrapeptide carboxypeptidase
MLISAKRSALPALAVLLLVIASGCRTTRGTGVVPPEPSAELPMIWPEPLEPGDTVMFVAPAGDLDEESILEAKRRLEARGYRVEMRQDLFAKEGYLAGPDKRRAKELMQAFLDPTVDAIFSGGGGYGTMRILDRLDYDKIRANPKIFIGFSDITGLHLALNRQAGLVTFHSPTSFRRIDSETEGMQPFTQEYLFRALVDDGEASNNGYTIDIPADAPQPVALGRGRARGRLAGGNLSLISALEGTPFAIDTHDAILLVEDTREAPYRIDRMLRQLQLAGKLDTLRGAVLGQFTRNYDREEDQMTEDPRFTVDGVLRQYFEPLGIPVLMNFPAGHSPYNATLPLGAQVEVDADQGTLRILPH